MPPIPLIKPSPCTLSEMSAALRGIEDSGVFSNYGPLNTRFEQRLAAEWFTGAGECLTVCNATIGLMMAIHATTSLHGDKRPPLRVDALVHVRRHRACRDLVRADAAVLRHRRVHAGYPATRRRRH